MMNIFIAFNEEYVLPTKVMLKSLIENNSESMLIYVFYSSLRQESIDSVLELETEGHVSFRFNKIDDTFIDGIPLAKQFTRETYYRLFAHRLFDKDVEKVLWIDGDMIINGSLSEFYKQDFKNKLFIAVENHYSAFNEEKRKILNMPLDSKYVNTGLMLLNLKGMREILDEEEIVQYLTDNHEILLLADQDVFNGLLYEYIMVSELDQWYNFFHTRITDANKNEVYEKARIIHYCGVNKPWNDDYSFYASDLWWKYALKTGPEYADLFIETHCYKNDLTRAQNENRDIEALEKEIEALKIIEKEERQELDSVRQSVSYRSGRIITWLPRKIRGGVLRFMDPGLLQYKYHNIGLLNKIGGLKAVRLKIEDKLTRSHKTMKYLEEMIDKASPDERPELLRAFYHLVTGTQLFVDDPASFNEKIVLDVYGARVSFLRAEAALKDEYSCLLEKWYNYVTGDTLNLKDPKSFNEKIQWLKLYDSTQIKTKLADKYLVREWISERIGEKYLVPLLGVWDSFDEIDFDKLPNQFALKCNHGSGWNLIVKDKEHFDKGEAKKKFDEWMDTNFAFFAGFELQYRDIPRKIIAEEYVEQMDGNLLDYKIHVFGGDPKIIQVVGDRDFEGHTAKENFFDISWNPVEMMYHSYDDFNPDYRRHKPMELNELLIIAKTLGEGFKYVRVDLYLIEDRIMFGEMTFTPASGIGKWNGEEQYLVGSWIDTNTEGSSR